MRRYVVILIAGLAIAAIGVLVGGERRIRRDPDAGPEPQRVVALDITVTSAEHLTPSVTSVPKDHRVRLSVTNRHRRPMTLTLMGYQDRFEAADVPPDSVWRGEFLADRPGDGFAWLLEGVPVGRLDVTGSHLVEGHR